MASPSPLISLPFPAHPSHRPSSLCTRIRFNTIHATPLQQETPAPGAPREEGTDSDSGCKACGKAQIEKGCNGEGRMQGGIGTIPGFGWWPIKAYRPCPSFVASGGKYRRKGQSMEEVAFGRKGSGDDLDITERLKGS